MNTGVSFMDYSFLDGQRLNGTLFDDFRRHPAKVTLLVFSSILLIIPQRAHQRHVSAFLVK